MAQKRRKNSLIVSFMLDKATLDRIDGRVAELAFKSRGKALSRSEWIKRAIHRDFDHDARSRRKRVNVAVHGVAGGQETADQQLPSVPVEKPHVPGAGEGIDPALLAGPSRIRAVGGPSGEGLQPAVPV